MSQEELQTTIEFLQGQVDDIRKLIEDELEKPIWGITALYHRRTDLRDDIYKVLER